MGLNTTVVVADSVLSDGQLEVFGIAPSGRGLATANVLLRSGSAQVCVVRDEACTVIAGATDEIADAIESDRLDLPGRIVAGTDVASVGYTDFRVFEAGQLVRHLCVDDGEITADFGAAVSGEDGFVVEGEPDGDVMIDRLPAIANVDPGAGIFDLHGQAYAGNAGYDDEATIRPATGTDDKPGLLRRLFGK